MKTSILVTRGEETAVFTATRKAANATGVSENTLYKAKNEGRWALGQPYTYKGVTFAIVHENPETI